MTLVARHDLRLLDETEKLLKKLEIEPFELEDDRPRRFRRCDEDDAPREASSAAPTTAYARPCRASPPGAPIFDKPSKSAQQISVCNPAELTGRPC